MRKKYIYLGLLTIILTIILSTIFLLKNNKKNNIKDYNCFLENKANTCFLEKDYINSISYYSKLIKLDTTKGEYFYKRGISFYFLDDYKYAISDFNKSINLNHKKSKSYYNIGFIYRKQNKDSLAYINFDQAYKCDTLNIEAKTYKEFLEHILKKNKL